MSKLSTHVLDTVRGRPAACMRVQLWRVSGLQRTLLLETVTNADGRTDSPLLEGESFVAADYEILFFAGEYFTESGASGGFLSVVPVRFAADPDAGNYHVPLLCSPWSYTTYRGS